MAEKYYILLASDTVAKQVTELLGKCPCQNE